MLPVEIEQFQRDSLARAYFAPFNINSKNHMPVPKENEDRFEELNDFPKACTQLTEQGDHLYAVTYFEIRYKLIETMEWVNRLTDQSGQHMPTFLTQSST